MTEFHFKPQDPNSKLKFDESFKTYDVIRFPCTGGNLDMFVLSVTLDGKLLVTKLENVEGVNDSNILDIHNKLALANRIQEFPIEAVKQSIQAKEGERMFIVDFDKFAVLAREWKNKKPNSNSN